MDGAHAITSKKKHDYVLALVIGKPKLPMNTVSRPHGLSGSVHIPQTTSQNRWDLQSRSLLPYIGLDSSSRDSPLTTIHLAKVHLNHRLEKHDKKGSKMIALLDQSETLLKDVEQGVLGKWWLDDCIELHSFRLLRTQICCSTKAEVLSSKT